MHFPIPIPFKTHPPTTFLALRRLGLLASVPPIDQNTKGFAHQFPALLAGLGLYLAKAGAGVLIVPAFQLIKHLPSFF
jgi:hypothetical protein